MNLPNGYTIGQMRAEELATIDDWAAKEGWNPGLSDLVVAWQYDPDAFIALRKGRDLVGAGSIISYHGRFGFAGLFIVRPDQRGQGLGRSLWHYLLDQLRRRVEPSATIGLDGVYDMAPYYARMGFKLAYRDLRFEGIADGTPDAEVEDLARFPFATVSGFDARFFPAERGDFLEAWIKQPGAHTAGLSSGGRFVGYGVARPCRSGFKLGPVFAERPQYAERIIGSLMHRIKGERAQLDVPEPNTDGTSVAKHFGLSESFGCARMYNGPFPENPIENIYGVSSFEFG